MAEESIREKRESDPIIDGGELPCGCWLLNSGSSEEQSVLLTTEPFLLSLGSDFFFLWGTLFLYVCSFGACHGTSSFRPGWLQTHRDLPVSAY